MFDFSRTDSVTRGRNIVLRQCHEMSDYTTSVDAANTNDRHYTKRSVKSQKLVTSKPFSD